MRYKRLKCFAHVNRSAIHAREAILGSKMTKKSEGLRCNSNNFARKSAQSASLCQSECSFCAKSVNLLLCAAQTHEKCFTQAK